MRNRGFVQPVYFLGEEVIDAEFGDLSFTSSLLFGVLGVASMASLS